MTIRPGPSREPPRSVALGKVDNDAATEPWRAVLQSFGLSNAEVAHVQRALWAALHGFVSLRGNGLMTRSVSPDRSFALMVDVFVDALQRGVVHAARRSPAVAGRSRRGPAV